MSRQGALRRRERLCETPVLLIACAFAYYHVQRNIVRLARQLLDAPAFIADSDCNRTRLQSGKGAVIITAAVAEPDARRVKAKARNQYQMGIAGHPVAGRRNLEASFFPF